MRELRKLREAAGASQIRIARLSGVPRMRLSLAENGDAELTDAEIAAVRRAIGDFAAKTAAVLEHVARAVQATA